MSESRRFGGAELILLLIVLAAAAGTRFWYLWECADHAQKEGPLQVQDAWPVLRGLPAGTELRGQKPPNELDALVHNLKEDHWFGCLAPLAMTEERTAHLAPGYPWLLSWLERSPVDLGPTDRTVRWMQCGLGSLTAALYFLFAFRAFGSRLVAFLAGILCAVHPFWIVNTAEINDGVLVSFLLALSLYLGASGGQSGAAFTSLLYGLSLAALALVRAAFLPFAVVALVWFLLHCRTFRRGWLCGLLAFLGLANGLTFWTIRNYRVPDWPGHVVPIADSTYLHLWIGNNPRSTGGPQSEQLVIETLAQARGETPSATAEHLAALNQRERYHQMGPEVWAQVQNDPAGTLRRRISSGLCFVLGEKWFKDGTLWLARDQENRDLPGWFINSYPTIFYAAVLALLGLGMLGWRWSYGFRTSSMPAALAVFWIACPMCSVMPKA